MTVNELLSRLEGRLCPRTLPLSSGAGAGATAESDELYTPATALLAEVVNWLRPHSQADRQRLTARILQLARALEQTPELRAQLAATLLEWLDSLDLFSALTATGLYSRRGFTRELISRIHELISPTPLEPAQFKDALRLIFTHPRDHLWVVEVDNAPWLRLLQALFTPPQATEAALPGSDDPDPTAVHRRLCVKLLYSLEMLAIWVAAEELDPDILRVDPAISEENSAFVSLQREITAYAEDWRHWLKNPSHRRLDDSRALVLLDQSRQEVNRIRRLAVTAGTTIALTHLLERLEQTLSRLHDLLDILEPPDPRAAEAAAMRLLRQIITGIRERRGIWELWQRNTQLIARSITENSSDHGEHYVTRSRRDYRKMLLSSGGAGLLIAIMAWLKLQIGELNLERGSEAFMVSLNYAAGFVLIHLLGFTVATKQPAMTASYFAQAIERGERGWVNHQKLARLLMEVGRSQFAAIAGNVVVAMGVATLIALVIGAFFEVPLLSQAQGEYLNRELRPLAGLALPHAAIAGLWLMFSGLIAGYCDNLAAYFNIALRVRRHPLLRRIVPKRWRERLGDYLAENYGALVGNFSFGLLLGMTGYLGYLLNLPLGVRHVAFSSANLAFASTSLNPEGLEFLLNLSCILLIGAVNLGVSFSLALMIALKARKARIGNPGALLRAYAREMAKKPLSLIFPPADSAKK